MKVFLIHHPAQICRSMISMFLDTKARKPKKYQIDIIYLKLFKILYTAPKGYTLCSTQPTHRVLVRTETKANDRYIMTSR